MYVIYLPVIVAVLAPAYYFAIHYWGDYPILDNYPKSFFKYWSLLGAVLYCYFR